MIVSEAPVSSRIMYLLPSIVTGTNSVIANPRWTTIMRTVRGLELSRDPVSVADPQPDAAMVHTNNATKVPMNLRMIGPQYPQGRPRAAITGRPRSVFARAPTILLG